MSLSVLSDLGWYYLFADRWREVADTCRETLERSSGYGWARACLAEALFQEGGDREVARRAGRSGDADPFYRAVFLSRLGKIGEAIGWLERAFDLRDPWLVFVRVDPVSIRSTVTPRFEALASKLRIGDRPPPTGLER